jgi:8-oxo-dGTP pyrophosphatase MutT (NUDIX family)
MALHPCKNNKGQSVIIKHPHSPTGLDTWMAADQVATVVPGGPMPDALGMIPFRRWDRAPEDRSTWLSRVKDTDLAEPPLNAKGLPPGAGVVVVEDDGRVWLIAPTNEYGGYKATFPKGRLTPGLSLQQSAVKEAFEEAGLRVLITAHLVDVPRSATYARYYLAHRVGGHPGEMGWESQAVHLVPQGHLATMLNSHCDKPILDALRTFPGRNRWADFILDWHGNAQRLCYTIEGFAVRHGRWPSRLLIDPEAWKYLQQAMTPHGFERLTNRLVPELQLRPTLAVADADGRIFDYDAEDAPVHPSSLPSTPASIWLWGVVRPDPFSETAR